MAKGKIRAASSLIGGGIGALDKFSGSLLVDKDISLAVPQADGLYPYWVDDDLGGAEDSPYVIVPDSSAENKRYVLTGFVGTSMNITVKSGDPILKFTIDNVDKWFVGVDDDDSDKLKVSVNSDLSSPAITVLNNGSTGFGSSAPQGRLHVGDQATNYLLMSDTGIVTLHGSAKRRLTLRADLDYTTITAQGKPTQVTIGIFHGYSMPIYAADNEELFFNENVPSRWDGASDIVFHVLVALELAETLGETFRFQFSWNQVGETDVVPVATHDVLVETTVVDGTQYATYELEFILDYDADVGDVVQAHDDLAGRLRRVVSTGDEVDGEVIVLDWHTHYTVDKMFKAP